MSKTPRALLCVLSGFVILMVVGWTDAISDFRSTANTNTTDNLRDAGIDAGAADASQTLDQADGSPRQTGAGVTLSWDATQPVRKGSLRARLLAPDGLPALIETINQTIVFSEPITVRVDVDDGPLFDPDTNEIWMPISFMQEVADQFVDDGVLNDDERHEILIDVLLHTLWHELGHALFAQYDLPMLAREEDAVDALANVMLLEFVEGGDDAALNAAELFGLESDEIEWFEADDFFDEHSLDIQRYYTTLCHVYGSDPDAHEDLVDEETGFSEERAELCELEYDQLRRSWLSVLRPWLLVTEPVD